MAIDIPKSSFSIGEVDPEWHGRAELGIYGQGVETMLNWIPTPKGGAILRPGTVFVAEVQDHSQPVELVDFVYGDDQEYVVAFNKSKARFFRDRGVIRSGETAIEKNLPWTLSGEDDIRDFDYDQDGLEMAITHRTGKYQPLTLERGGDHVTWTLDNTAFSSKPNEWTGDKWPKLVKFFEGRAAYASTPEKPMDIWLGQSGNSKAMTGGSGDAAAMHFPIKAKGSITSLAEGDVLILGTSKAMRTIGNRADILTPTANTQKKRTESFIAPVRPLQVGLETLLVGHDRQSLYRFAYEFASDNFVDQDLAETGRHMLASGIRKTAFCPYPFPVIWLLLNDGTLVSITYSKALRVVGMARHQIAGRDDESDSDHGFVESITAISGEKHSELWLTVRRTINGQTKRYIEYMSEHFNGRNMDRADAVLVDSAIAFDGEATGTFTGAGHLEGETVALMADGATMPAATVASGSFTLNAERQASKLIAGLGYDKVIMPLRPVFQTQAGRNFGEKVKAVRYNIDLLNTGGLLIGDKHAVQRLDGQNMDEAVPLYTGFADEAVDSRWDADEQPKIWQRGTEPQPATIRAMVGTYVTRGA